MKSLHCADLGGNCEYISTGETDEAVKMAMWKHGAEDRTEIFASLTEDQKAEMKQKWTVWCQNNRIPTVVGFNAI